MYIEINSYISAFWVYWSIFYIRVPQRGETGSDFKTCGDELILDILELQMMSKKKVLGIYIGNFETLLDILELQMKSKNKKKVLGIYIGNFETYTRHSRVADEKRSQGAIAFLNSLKGAIWKKSLGNSNLHGLKISYQT